MSTFTAGALGDKTSDLGVPFPCKRVTQGCFTMLWTAKFHEHTVWLMSLDGTCDQHNWLAEAAEILLVLLHAWYVHAVYICTEHCGLGLCSSLTTVHSTTQIGCAASAALTKACIHDLHLLFERLAGQVAAQKCHRY